MARRQLRYLCDAHMSVCDSLSGQKLLHEAHLVHKNSRDAPRTSTATEVTQSCCESCNRQNKQFRRCARDLTFRDSCRTT